MNALQIILKPFRAFFYWHVEGFIAFDKQLGDADFRTKARIYSGMYGHRF